MNLEDLYRLLRTEHVQAQGMIDTIDDPLLVLDQGLCVQTASRAFYETFEVSRDETVGRPIYELGNGQWDIPELRRLLNDDVRAAYAGDPAAKNVEEIVFAYPSLEAICAYRIAHRLCLSGVPMIPRIITEHAHSRTGVDISPGAKIGESFFIDHGTGVVIGETAEIGDNVTIYQSVTLGGTNPSTGVAGKRHPTIRDGVVIGSGAQVLGPIEVGEGAKIGANAVVTKDVPAGATVVGIPAKPVPIDTVHYSPGFVPYGTPCGENCDPALARVNELEAQLEELRAELKAIRASRQPAPKAKSA